MRALLTLALETSVIATGIWSAGTAIFYGSHFTEKVEVWFNQTETKLANYGYMENNASESVVTTIVIKPSKEGKTFTRIIMLNGGTTSTSEEAVTVTPGSKKAGNSNDKPTSLPKISVLVGDKWLEQRKIAKNEVKTRKTKIKGPLPFSTTKCTTFKNVPATWAAELEYARLKILLFFTIVGNFFASNLQRNFEWLKYASNAVFANTTPYTAGSNNTSCTYIISDCNISSIFKTIWSASQFIGNQLFLMTSYFATPFIWTGIKIMIPLLRWFIFDIVCLPPCTAFRYASDGFSIISKFSSQIWFMYKKSDTVLFLIVLVLLVFGCVLFCCFGDYLFGDDDDNNHPDGDLPCKAPGGTSILSPGVTGPSSTPSTGKFLTNNTRDMISLSEFTDAERRRLRIEASENVARDEDKQNRVYVEGNNGTEKTPSIKTPITPIEEDNRTINGTQIEDLVSKHPRGVSRRTIPDPFPNETAEERTARFERLATRRKRENEELPQRLRDKRERCYQEILQKKQSDIRKQQSEEELRMQEARNQLRSTAERFLALKGGEIKNTTLQPETTLAKVSDPETEKTSTTEGDEVKTTVIEAPVRQPTITTDSLVQTPASTSPRPNVRRGHDKKGFNKNDPEIHENDIPLKDLPTVQQPASQIENNKTGSRGRENQPNRVRKPLGIFEVNEKRGMVKYAGTQSPSQPDLKGSTQFITPGLKQPTVGGPDDKDDGGADIMPGGGRAITGGIRDTDISFDEYGAETTRLVTPESPIGIVQPTSPRDIDLPPSRTVTVVDPTLLHAPSVPKFNHSRKGSDKQRTPRIPENAAKPNEPPSTPSVELYTPIHPCLPTSTELTTTKAVEPYKSTKHGLPPTLPLDQYDPTKIGKVHGPRIQEPAQLIVQGSAQPPLAGLSLSTLPGLSLSTVNKPSQSNGQGSAHFVVPKLTQPTIQDPVQSHGGDFPIEEAPRALMVPLALTVLPTIDDDEEMVFDSGNDKQNEDDKDVDMGEADYSPTQGDVHRPLLSVSGSIIRTSALAPQPPAAINNGPWSDDVNMGEDTPEVTMGEDLPQPIPLCTVLASAPPYSIKIFPAPPRPNQFGTEANSQSSPFGTVGAPNPITIVPTPPQPDPSGIITNQWPSTTSTRSSFSDGLPMRASVGNGFGGSQSTQALITSACVGHFTQTPINDASGGSQHGQGTTVAHTPSTQTFGIEGLSNPSAWLYSSGGPKMLSDSGSLTPSQQAKTMTPRKRLIPKSRGSNTNILKKDDFVKGEKANTDIKWDSSPKRNITFSVPDLTIRLEETDAERQLRELTAKMDTQADRRRREMVRQNTELEFGTAEDNADWHESTGGKNGQVVFTKEDFQKKQTEFKRLQRKARDEAKTESAADLLMKMNAADQAKKKRQEKDLESVLAISGGAAEANEEKQDDEESEISDLDEADLADITDQVNHNQALADDAERLRKQ
jgi:hypothetical protein